MERFEEGGRRGALVGPRGHGKTTLWLEMASRLEHRGWQVHRLRLSSEARRPGREAARRLLDALRAPSASNLVVAIDGAEQWSAWEWLLWRWRLRRAGGVLVTVHRPGRLPTLHRARTSPELLGELVRELLLGPESPPAAPSQTSPSAVDEKGTEIEERRAFWARVESSLPALYERHRGNLRACLRELYDRWGEEAERQAALS